MTENSWWQKNKRPLIIATLIILLLLIVFALAVYLWGWDWTGFSGGESKMTTTPQGNNTEYSPSKTFWDWLSLLFVPGVLTLVAIWFTSQQNHDRGIASDNQHEAGLQAYIDNMSEL